MSFPNAAGNQPIPAPPVAVDTNISNMMQHMQPARPSQAPASDPHLMATIQQMQQQIKQMQQASQAPTDQLQLLILS